VVAAVAAVTGASAVAACSMGSGRRAPKPRAGADVIPAGGEGTWPVASSRFLQVVAHPDDDIYFMNPDLLHSLRQGSAVTTVYLTSGEDRGLNTPNYRDTDLVPDMEGYSAARQNGARAAYALMATGDRGAVWRREVLPLEGGAQAEIDHLPGAPHLTLIWLGLRKTQMVPGGPLNGILASLWSGSIDHMKTMVATGSPVGGPYRHTRASLISALVGIYRRFEPTVLRTLDIDPDYLLHSATVRRHADYGNHADHGDHGASALFAWEAFRAYDTTRCSVETYRGYYNERWPYNLGPRVRAEKKHIIDIYGWSDDFDCGDPAGCGDRGVGTLAFKTGWVQSTTPRHPGTGTWVQAQADGRLSAFAVLGTDVVRWVQTAPGADTWSPPERLPAPEGSAFAPQLAVTRDADGRLVVAALRIAVAARPERQQREIVLMTQSTPNGPFGSWTGLGNPGNGPDPDRVRGLGAPTLTTDGAGRVHVLVRGFGKGLCTRVREKSGTWGPWRDLGGATTMEGMSAVRGTDGHIEVFASTATGVNRWVQGRDGRVAFAGALAIGRPGGPPVASVAGNGAITVHMREADTGRLLRLRQTAPGAWPAKSTAVGDVEGLGVPAVVAANGSNAPGLVVQRNVVGAVGVTVDHGSADVHARWADTGGLFVHVPAVVSEADGRALLVLLSTDGRLLTSRQVKAGDSLFGPWKISD